MTTTTKLTFGCNRGLPEDIKTAWGARAITKPNGSIDLLWDRQDNIGEEADRHALHDALGAGALDKFRVHVATTLGHTAAISSSEEVYTYETDGVRFAYSPQGSYGYLYIAAWLIEG